MSATATIGTTTATAMRPPGGRPPPLSESPPLPAVAAGAAPEVEDEPRPDDGLRVLVFAGAAGAEEVEVISIV